MTDVKRKVYTFIASYGKITYLFLIIILFFGGILSLRALSRSNTLEVTFLDIGQGDAILVTTPSGKQMLIDGGPTDKILGELSKHVPYFDHTLDVIVETHPDADHVTGLIPVLHHYDVGKVITSNVKGNTGVFATLTQAVDEEHADVYVAHIGDEIDFGDGVVAHILYPGDTVARDTNDGSVTMVITYGEQSYLLTGDLPLTLEPYLLQDVLPHHVSVYKAGHHGSKTSSGIALLSYIKPEYAIISAGKNNKYGHPNVETLGRLATFAKETLSTIDHGDITFTGDGHALSISTDR